MVCHLAIALPLAWYLNIWSDEASSLYSTESISFAFQHSAIIERQAPLYFWLLSLWRGIDGSIFFARLLSVAFMLGAIWLFAGTALRMLNSRRGAVLATAFFALHPIAIWASTEIRVYALVILLSIVLVRLFFAAFFGDAEPGTAGRKTTAKVLFAFTSIVALYTNYYLGFLLVGLFASLVVSGKFRPAVQYLAVMAATAVAASPLAIVFQSQLAVNTTDIGQTPTVIDGMRHLWNHVLTFILPADIRTSFEASTVGLIRLWIVRAAIALLAVTAAFRWRRITRRTVALGVISSTILAGLLTAYFFVGGSLVELRHASVLFAPLLLFGASLINDLLAARDTASERFRYFALFLTLLAAAFFWYALVNHYPGWTKNGDWERVATYIEQNERPGQPIVVFHTYDALALPYHYHGPNRVLPDERFFDFDFGVPTPERISERTAFTISKIPADAAEIWLVVNDGCKQPGVCDEFQRYINENFELMDQRAFYRNNVMLLRRRRAYQ